MEKCLLAISKIKDQWSETKCQGPGTRDQVSRISRLKETPKRNGTMLASRINLVFAQSLSLLSRKPKVGFTGRLRTGVGEMAMSGTRNTQLPLLTSKMFLSLLTSELWIVFFHVWEKEHCWNQEWEGEDAGLEEFSQFNFDLRGFGRGCGKLILNRFSFGFHWSSNPSLPLKNLESLMGDVCKLFASENTKQPPEKRPD